MASPEVSKGRLIFAAILAIYVYGSIALLLGTILPALAKQFNLNDSQASWLPLCNAIGLIVSSLTIGPIIDKRGKKTGLVGGLFGILLALLGLAAAPSYELALGSLVLLGLGGGMIVTGANALVSDLDAARRASTLNLLNLFFGLGGMTTPFLAANVLQITNAATICYLLAGLVAFTFLVHLTTAMPPPSGAGASVGAGYGHLLATPAFYLLAFQLFLYVGVEVGTSTWLTKYLTDPNGPIKLSDTVANNILSFGFAGGILVGRVLISRVITGIAEWKVTLGASLAIAVTTYGALQVSSQMAVMVVVFCAGLAMAPMFPTVLAMVGNTFTQNAAQAMGTVITIGWFGFLTIPPLVGNLGGSLSTGLLLIPACAIVMALTNLGLRGTAKISKST